MFLLTVAGVLAVLNAYIGYRTFVFKVRGHWWRDLARFSLVYVAAFIPNLVLLPLLVEVVHVPVLPAQALVARRASSSPPSSATGPSRSGARRRRRERQRWAISVKFRDRGNPSRIAPGAQRLSLIDGHASSTALKSSRSEK